MKNISLDFQGYWIEANKSYIPNHSGIYCVYRCQLNRSSDTVSIHELIYVGESANVRARVADHERLSDWNRRLKAGEILCYSFADVAADDRVRAEAAVIYYHKPPCNTEYKHSFPYADTTIRTSGSNTYLSDCFTVYRT